MIDLHGYHIHEAWRHFNNKIDDAYYRGMRKVVVITGQGDMMREMPQWITNHPRIREYRQANHNPGSFTCFLEKKRQKKVDK